MPGRRILAELPRVTRAVTKSMRLEEDMFTIGIAMRMGQRCRCPHRSRRPPVHKLIAAAAPLAHPRSWLCCSTPRVRDSSHQMPQARRPPHRRTKRRALTTRLFGGSFCPASTAAAASSPTPCVSTERASASSASAPATGWTSRRATASTSSSASSSTRPHTTQ